VAASGVLLGVSSFIGSAWKYLGCRDGCTDWCAVDMGVGVGGCDGVLVPALVFPGKLRMV